MPPDVAVALDATLVNTKFALATTGLATVAVLFPGVESAVVLVTRAVLVTLPVDAVTNAVNVKVMVWPEARLAKVTVAPPGALDTDPKFDPASKTTNPARTTSVNVTLSATLGPKLTTVTV